MTMGNGRRPDEAQSTWPKKDREAVPINAETATSESMAVSRFAIDHNEC